MSAERIEVDYEQLAKIEQLFADCAAQCEHTLLNISRCAEDLYASGWSGRAADRFINELSDEVLPSLARLCEGLVDSEETVARIIEIMQEAENRAASLFNGDGIPEPVPVNNSPEGSSTREWLQIGAELVLSILWEPADWFFTIRDVAQGDYWALVGLIPFVPSRAGKVLRKLFGSTDEAQTIIRKLDNIPNNKAARSINDAGRMAPIHNSQYRASRQQVLRNAVNDPNLPRYKRGWYQQEINRLERLQQRKQAGFNLRKPQFLNNLTPEQIREIEEKRAYRARLRGTRPTSTIHYDSRTIRIDPNSDMGHRDNRLPLDRINRPDNLRIEERGMNRSRGGKFRH